MLALWRPRLTEEPVEGGQVIFYISACVGLTLLAGAMSGLTLGLMSMSAVDVEACP